MKKQIWAVLAMSLLTACGSDPVQPTDFESPQPPTPSASITASGEGALILHPSINPAYAVAMETPIRLTETAGGTADWHFVRMSLRRGGVEIERTELGADAIRSAGFGNIAARSNETYTVLFRFNSSDFDQVDFTLGFGDKKDGRQFTVPLSLESFQNVGFNPIPLSREWSRLPM